MPFETQPLDSFDRQMATNVRAPFALTQAALPYLKPAGAVVNISSIAGYKGFPQSAAYCASKGAVIAFSRAMAVDHVSDGIRVNCVCPGTIDSPWIDRLVADGAAREDLVARQPLGRLGTPDEVAEAILYLASDQAGFSTGTSLVVDGGTTAA
jgi:NAD(P)-dependent dehydrogenase (short-subunit alcohol dehydrogenase family)